MPLNGLGLMILTYVIVRPRLFANRFDGSLL